MCNNCSSRTFKNKNSKNPKRICDECWEKRQADAIQILAKPEEIETPSFAETLGIYAQVALLTKPKQTDATDAPYSLRNWTKPLRAKDMSMQDIESQLQSRSLDVTGSDSERIDRLQKVLDEEERFAAAASGVIYLVSSRSKRMPAQHMWFAVRVHKLLFAKFQIISSQ